MNRVPVDAEPVDEALLRGWPLPVLSRESDKEDRGSTLVVAGSREMPGAAWLAAVAALRAGAGKLAVATASSVARGLALRLPEARVIGLPEQQDGAIAVEAVDLLAEACGGADAVLVGPGMQGEAGTTAFVRALVERLGCARHGGAAPFASTSSVGRTAGAASGASAGTANVRRLGLVLDALAMNVVAGRSARTDDIGERHQPFAFGCPALFTPHAGEMAHLTGLSKDEVCRDPLRVAREAARRWHAVVALKGASTVVCSPDGRAWRHDGGGVGLATSGSGDTLVGVIAGLVARGASLEQAAVWGVVLHARAGDALALRHGSVGFLASELLGEIAPVLQRLSGPTVAGVTPRPGRRCGDAAS